MIVRQFFFAARGVASPRRVLCYSLLAFFVLCLAPAAAQNETTAGPPAVSFRGTASLTHNGISLVPSFSLGEPALLLDLKVSRGRWSFEPDLRLALEGKPWSMLFWLRHQTVRGKRFTLRTGAHPAVNFRTIPILRNGQTENILEARRYLAAELVPDYKITDRLSVGAYYLFGRGFDAGAKQVNFLVLNANFAQIPVGKKASLRISPQVYYLGQDELTGYYTVGYLTLALKNQPLAVTGILNQAITTEILPEEPTLWTVLFTYRFGEGAPLFRKREALGQ